MEVVRYLTQPSFLAQDVPQQPATGSATRARARPRPILDDGRAARELQRRHDRPTALRPRASRGWSPIATAACRRSSRDGRFSGLARAAAWAAERGCGRGRHEVENRHHPGSDLRPRASPGNRRNANGNPLPNRSSPRTRGMHHASHPSFG